MHTSTASFLSLLLLAPAADGWLGIYLDSERTEAVVTEVIPESPAAKAGLQAGDVLFAVDDKATPTREQFVAAIRAGKAGDRVRIQVRRGEQEHVVVVRLGERPEEVAAPTAPVRPAQPSKTRELPRPAAEPAPSQRGYLGLGVAEGERGVVVDRVLPDGPAAAAGVVEGDIVTKVGDDRIGSLEDLDRAMQTLPPGRTVAVGLRSEAGARSVMVTLGQKPGSASAEARRPAIAVAPVQPSQPTPPVPTKSPRGDLEAELQALRAELAELRQQLEALRQDSKGKGKE